MSLSEYLQGGMVPRSDVRMHQSSFPVSILAVVAIYSMIVPFVLIDASVALYHAVYFRAFGLPFVRRKDHVVLDRGRLAGLNFGQRVNCLYCDYANGVLSWVRAVTTVTEAYSCAIKHPSGIRSHDASGYYEAADFAIAKPVRK
jgi:hypothetical protein